MEKVQRTIGILRDIEPDALFAIELLRALGEENLANRMKKTADVIADIKDRIFGFLVELDCEGDE
jgi:translation elongation factor EF-Ts